MKLKNSQRPILIYGMGDGCDKILRVCQEKGISIQGIFSSDDYVRGKVIHGFDVIGYTEAKKRFPNMIALLAFGVFRDDLMEWILKVSQETELLAPEVPLFGGGLFDLEYYNAHKDKIKTVREMLADEESLRVFDSLIEYKLTGSILPLIRCQSEKEKDQRELIPYQKGDTYIDLGAYDGDTVLEWVALHPDHGEILAVEPNAKTFSKLVEKCKALPFFSAVEGAVWNKQESLTFNGKSGRSSAVSKDGTVRVNAFPLDEIAQNADFIKFDVEGAEKEAIEGCERLMRKKKPTLCISAYHRTEDLFAIPLQVKKICPEYRVYLRHWQYIPAWDTVYYFSAR